MPKVAKNRIAVSLQRRSVVLLVVMAMAATGLGVRLTYLQMFKADAYVDYGRQQRIHTQPLSAERGRILDRNGIDLAVSVPRQTIWTDPELVDDPARSAALLSPVMGLSVEYLQERLEGPGRFAYLDRLVPDEVAEQVRALALPGVYMDTEPARANPAGPRLGKAVLGIVNVDHVGISGLEYQYDDLLGGEPGLLLLESDPEGRTIPFGDREVLKEARAGVDLVTTIDRSLQFETERVLTRSLAASGGASATAVIMEVATGEILAMASVDGPQEPDDAEDNPDAAGVPPRPSNENRAVTWSYEPGSAMKAMVMAGVLEEELAAPSTTRTVQQSLELYDREFTDDRSYGAAEFSLSEILAHSSNTGTILWALDLGASRYASYMAAFGFGTTTGLGFKGESAGLVPRRAEWSGTDIGSFALGQGLLVSPLQLLTAYNTIANGGVHVVPTLVRSVISEEGRRVELPETPKPVRVVSENTASRLTSMLAGVVRWGTGQNAAVDGYTVAGKTGTGQKAQANGTYFDDEGLPRYTATFVGFYPAEDPKLSMIVVMDEPAQQIYASAVVAPIFSELARYSLQRLRIAPPAEVIVVPTAPAPATPTPDPQPQVELEVEVEPEPAPDGESDTGPEPEPTPGVPEGDDAGR